MKRFCLSLILALAAATALPAVMMTVSPVAYAASANVGDTDGCVKLSVDLPGIPKNADGEVCGDPNKGGVITLYLTYFLKFLFGLVTAIIVLMMVVSGVQYITSAGSPDAVKSAKKRLTNAITALILFLVAYAVLNFIIPGGIV